MKGFKRCSNGHFYKEDLQTCPHCSGGAADNDLGKTKVNTTQGDGFDKTQIFGQGGGGNEATNAGGGNDSTQVFGSGSSSAASGRDLDRTYIGGVTDEDGSGDVTAAQPRAQRKIVGWLVSFTLDPMGVDYRIYEGSNSVGKDTKNTITITSDHTISGEHVNILFRRDQFHIKDKMTTNGTFLNGDDMEVEKAYSMKDGDEVKMGDTVFIFKTWY